MGPSQHKTDVTHGGLHDSPHGKKSNKGNEKENQAEGKTREGEKEEFTVPQLSNSHNGWAGGQNHDGDDDCLT